MTDDANRELPRHPIRVVAERTGLTPDVLRAWQKRYGFVKPGRSERGQRLYSDAEVERLRLAALAVQGGRTPANVSRLSTSELQALVEEDERQRVVNPPRVHQNERVAEAITAVHELDAERLEATLRRSLMLMSVPRFLDEIVSPLFAEVGIRWHSGDISPAHEHMASAVTRRVLDWVIASCDAGDSAPRILVATLPNELHEIGALLVATTAATAGWRITYLGANLPVADIAAAAEQLAANVVAVSAIYSVDVPNLQAELRELRNALSGDVELWIGGSAVDPLQLGSAKPVIRQMRNLDDLRGQLWRSQVSRQPRWRPH